MRTRVSLLLLGIALVLLHHYTASAPLAARASVALGTVLVLAELGGRLAARWRLPRVAAFVLTGLVCAPAALGVVRPDEVRALGFVGDAALALFVLRAGLGVGRPSAAPTGGGRFLAGSLVVPFALTTAVVYAVHPWFPLTVHQPWGDAVAVAVVLGALTAVAAPALSWATLKDAPGGALADALLRLNVQREFAAVLLFAGALVVARAVASPGALEPRTIIDPLVALGVSLVVGGLLAWLASRYLRLLDADPGVFLVGLAFGAAVAAWSGPAEVTLAALVTGLVLARLDEATAERLRQHFDTRGIVLTAAAFALLGLGLDASSVADVWPWILLLVGVRAIGLFAGGRLAGDGPVGTEALATRGWLGLVPQAGLGVFLAGVGRRAFPEWGVSFEGLVVGLVAVHAVMGPICLHRAVSRRPVPMEGASGGTQ
jgi:Kef-type K+ transport system membrane component KefB